MYYVQCRQEYEVASVHCVVRMADLPDCEWLHLDKVSRKRCEELVAEWPPVVPVPEPAGVVGLFCGLIALVGLLALRKRSR